MNNLGYEETRNVAKTLREFGKLDDAIETFKRASSLQEDNWSARIGLARAYDYQGQYVLALETLEALKASIDSGESKPSDPKYYLHPITQHLAELHEKIGNAEKAWDIYESILQEHPDDYETAHAMALLLHGRRNYTQLVEFLEGLKRSKDEVTGLDRRTQMFHVYFWVDNFHGAIAAAGKSLNGNGITTLKDSYRTAVDAAEKMSQDQLGRGEESYRKGVMAMLMHHCAKFFYNNSTCAEENEMALSMWVRIIHLDDTDRNLDLSRAKLFATRELSSHYFEKALQAGHGTQLAAKYIDDLEHLATLESDGSLTDQTKEKYPQQLLARYYGLCGKTEKAKNAIRAFVKLNIDLLSDDDPSNDWQGFMGLAAHFMFAGQDDNCLAAWSLIVPNQDDDTPVTNELEGPLKFGCDGKCGKIWTYADDMYVCRVCADVQFDESCLRKLQEGTLGLQVCNKSHEMLHVPKYDEYKLKKIGKGNVMVGQEVMAVEDWLQKIKQDWGLSTE